jgi:uncharacterized protein
MRSVVVDTGPLVAYFDVGDHDHESVHAWFAAHATKHRLLTTEAVVTEVTHMLDFNVEVQAAFAAWAAVAIAVKAVPQAAYDEIALWMRRYEKVPMDFADATVLWLYRETKDSRILTLDERGFGVFRLPAAAKKKLATVAL